MDADTERLARELEIIGARGGVREATDAARKIRELDQQLEGVLLADCQCPYCDVVHKVGATRESARPSEPVGRPCRGCGMPLEWLPAPSGKVLPAQRVRTVYYLTDGASQRLERLESEDGLTLPPHYVSHFETCPAARRFSSSRRQKPGGERG